MQQRRFTKEFEEEAVRLVQTSGRMRIERTRYPSRVAGSFNQQSGHGNGLRPCIRNSHRRTAHEPVNLPLDCKHAHVNGHSPLSNRPD